MKDYKNKPEVADLPTRPPPRTQDTTRFLYQVGISLVARWATTLGRPWFQDLRSIHSAYSSTPVDISSRVDTPGCRADQNLNKHRLKVFQKVSAHR